MLTDDGRLCSLGVGLRPQGHLPARPRCLHAACLAIGASFANEEALRAHELAAHDGGTCTSRHSRAQYFPTAPERLARGCLRESTGAR